MLRVWKRQTKLPGELSTRSWTGLVLPLDVLPCGLSWNLTFLSRSLTTMACGFGLAYHMPAARRSLSKVGITFELMAVQITVRSDALGFAVARSRTFSSFRLPLPTRNKTFSG